MSTAQELYNKAMNIWENIPRENINQRNEWLDVHRPALLEIVSYLNQAIGLVDQPNANYLAAMSGVMSDLDEYQKAQDYANQALIVNPNVYEARHTIFVISLRNYIGELKSGEGLIGGLSNLLGVGKQAQVKKSFENLVVAFKCETLDRSIDYQEVIRRAQNLLYSADMLTKVGYSKIFAKEMIQIILDQLKALTNCGEHEEAIRKCQAAAEGALELL